jgi:hypothetical protein|nr:MAG TPA: hypothetical protein [Caudoviricetes sp.]
MTVPKYVIEMISRAKYEFDFFKNNAYYAAGYTIRIRKSTPYTKIDTFKSEIERLKKWVQKNNGEMRILDIPTETHYVNQYAVVTIFDPVMKHIENYIL